MSDARLIDANALIKDLELLAKYQGECKQSTILGVCGTIKWRKTIDAVPVVRCRECKESEQLSVLDTDCLYCGVWDTAVHCNGYCYHGARMDGGAECV